WAGFKRRARRQLSVPDQHALRIARDTLRMPDAMVGVMGGPDKETARRIIKSLTGRGAKGNPKRILGRSWTGVHVRRHKGKGERRNPLRRRKRNPGDVTIIDTISPGDRVTIVDRFGKERTGRAVMVFRGSHATLNMGGAHGTPAVATP